MTNYTFSKLPTINFNTTPPSIARSATGSVYDVGDTNFNTPLNITLVVGGAVVTTISSDALGLLPDFTLLDRTTCVWKQTGSTFATVLTTSDPIPGPPGPNTVPTQAAIQSEVTTAGTPTQAALSATYDLHSQVTADWTKADGVTDNYAYLQGLIDSAANTGFSIVRIPRGKNGDWMISQGLKVNSRQTIDARGARIVQTASAQDYLISNKAVDPIATISGISSTVGSAAISSPGGTLDPANNGKQVAVLGAGFSGSPWYGTYSHTSTTSGTMSPVVAGTPGTTSITALTAVTGASMQVFNRDSFIKIIGGRWVKPTTTATTLADDYRLHLMMFRRVDGIKIEDPEFESAGNAKYCINLGDVSDYHVNRPFFNGSISDGVHINGPATRGSITGARGVTQDDFVSFTAADYWDGSIKAKFNDVSGDIVDCSVTDIAANQSKSGVKILGGGQYKIRGVDVRRFGGSVTRNAIYIADDLTGSSDVSFTADGVTCRPGTGYATVFINATNAKDITLDNIAPTITAAQTSPALQVSSNAVVKTLKLGGWVVRDAALSTYTLMQINSGCTVNDIIVNGMVATYPTETTGTVFSIIGTVDRIKIANSHFQNAKTVVLHNNGASALVVEAMNVTADNIEHFVTGAAANALDVAFTNCSLDAFGSYARTTGTGVLTVRGESPRNLRSGTTNGLIRSASQSVRCIVSSLPVDVSILAKNMGDRAYNTNASLACGVGPVISDGTNWKHTYTGAIY